MLKSFRDKAIAFPPYRDGAAASPTLADAGAAGHHLRSEREG